MKYVVVEFQTFENGAMSTPCWAYDERNKAEAKYHSVLAGAAVSALPMHACSLMQADGRLLACQSYEHVVEPEPEPEPEPTEEEGE